jgi:hypothetical protein
LPQLQHEHRPFGQSQPSGRTDPVRFLADRYAEVAADGAEGAEADIAANYCPHRTGDARPDR